MKRNEFKSIFVKFDEKRGVCHQLFIKQHKVRKESGEKPSDFTLFVCNIPPYCTQECLRCLFEDCGSIKSILFVNTDTLAEVNQDHEQFHDVNYGGIVGYKMAYIIFDSATSLQTTLALEEGKVLSVSSYRNRLITGMKKWCWKYNTNFLDPVELQKDIDSYMAEYDQNENHEKVLAPSTNESDEDGWIAVSKRSRNPGFARKQSVRNNILQKINRKKKKKELLNFYSFQIRESKMNHLITLRKKFEEDKKKVQTLKTQRKFKPL